MKICFFVFLLIFDICTCAWMLSPFSSIKIVNDNIYVTLDNDRAKWNQLLSIDNYGVDSIVKYAKELYGTNNCDYQISCYKYNIIANFEDVYLKVTGKTLPKHSSIELFDNIKKKQIGLDVENTNDKFKRTQDNIENNVKSSKSTKLKMINLLSYTKGIEEEKNEKTMNSFLKKKENENKNKEEIIELDNPKKINFHFEEDVLFLLVGVFLAILIGIFIYYFKYNNEMDKDYNEVNVN